MRAGLYVIIFTIGAVGFVGLVAAVLVYPAFVTWDERLSAAFADLSTPAVREAFQALTVIGDWQVMLLLTVAVAAFLHLYRMRLEALLLVGTVGVGAALGAVAKVLVQRARPGLEYAHIPLPDSYSFPSGHSLASFLFFGTIIFLLALNARSRWWRYGVSTICVALAALVAISRVNLGVHWFGDVIASWMLGAAWMTITVALYFRFSNAEE